jgi:hypothetical protein
MAGVRFILHPSSFRYGRSIGPNSPNYSYKITVINPATKDLTGERGFTIALNPLKDRVLSGVEARHH